MFSELPSKLTFRSNHRALPTLLGSLICLTVIGCAGGGGNGAGGGGTEPGTGNPPGGGSQTPGDVFLLYQGSLGVPFQGSLNVVDPIYPEVTFVIENTLIDSSDLDVGGTWNLANQSLQGYVHQRLFYAKGNDLMELDLRISRSNGNAIAPVARSFASFGSAVLGVEVYSDFVNDSAASTFVVQRLGGIEVFTEDAMGSTPPLTFPGTPVEGLYNPDTGAFLGWLAIEGGMLTRVSRDLSVQLLATANTVESIGSQNSSYLMVDSDLMHYDVVSNTLTNLMFDAGNLDMEFSGERAGVLFFALQSADNFEVFRTDQDGPVTSLFAQLNARLLGAALVDSRIVFVHENTVSFEKSLISRLHNGNDPVVLYAGSDDLSLGSGTPFSQNDTVYYNIANVSAVAVKADGTGSITRPGGAWMPPVFTDEFFLDGDMEVEFNLLLTRLGGVPAYLTVVDPTNLSSDLRYIGQLGPNFQAFVSNASLRKDTLGIGVEVNLPEVQTDVFIFDAEVAESLMQVTDTSDKSEALLN